MKVLVAGYSGRMGQEILALASEFSSLEFVAGVGRGEDSALPKGMKVFRSFADVDVAVDLVIDFSLPEVTESMCAYCAKHSAALVSGVTGLNDGQKQAMAALSKKVAVLWSPNMSLGIAWLNQAIKKLGSLDGFDFQVEEFHHNKKIDRPSGTGVLLQDTLMSSVQGDVPEVVSIRGGGIFGIHRVHAMSEGETLGLEHVALNRSVFARGALKAATWLVRQSAGRYELKDVLGLG